ncbi:hypothetical protein C8Q77DRAFT_587944 [Trametes polyzona]|nr:hypothetical protein C8Q77DRAFT_587944 [Trametes polyzona]
MAQSGIQVWTSASSRVRPWAMAAALAAAAALVGPVQSVTMSFGAMSDEWWDKYNIIDTMGAVTCADPNLSKLERVHGGNTSGNIIQIC